MFYRPDTTVQLPSLRCPPTLSQLHQGRSMLASSDLKPTLNTTKCSLDQPQANLKPNQVQSHYVASQTEDRDSWMSRWTGSEFAFSIMNTGKRYDWTAMLAKGCSWWFFMPWLVWNVGTPADSQWWITKHFLGAVVCRGNSLIIGLL